jgi:hypothetical protein
MPNSAIRRGKVIGTAVTAAVLLATLTGGGAAQAAQHPDPFTRGTAPAASGTVGTAELEHVPSECTVKSYSPTTIVLGTTSVSKTIKVTAKNCTLDLWSLVVWPFFVDAPLSTVGAAGNYWYWDQNAAGDDVKVILRSKISLSPRHLSNSYAGRWTQGAYARAYGEEDRAREEADDTIIVDWASADLPLTLKRRATFGSTFNASPEPVRKGKKLTLKASLARVNWNGAKKLKYVGFAGKARVQFKAAGTTKYVTKKTVRATSKGKVSTTITVTKSGTWRLYFPGLSTTAPAISGTDVVKVN